MSVKGPLVSSKRNSIILHHNFIFSNSSHEDVLGDTKKVLHAPNKRHVNLCDMIIVLVAYVNYTCVPVAQWHLWPLLLTWINFNPHMDK